MDGGRTFESTVDGGVLGQRLKGNSFTQRKPRLLRRKSLASNRRSRTVTLLAAERPLEREARAVLPHAQREQRGDDRPDR
jgi:hypothetical protein